MPSGSDPVHPDDLPPRLSLSQRILLALPRLRRDGAKAPLSTRLRDAVVKPVDPDAAKKAKAPDAPLTVPELEDAVAFANDKERLTVLLLAPVAAAIGLLVIADRISNNPPAILKGKINPLHVSIGLLHELEVVLLVLAFLMLLTAFYRKRLFLGIVMALYGLAVFNLHYWGFGGPFILVGALFLIRSYRLQRDLKEATGEGPGRSRPPSRGTGRGGGGAPGGVIGATGWEAAKPRPNRRYSRPTPPPPAPKRSPKAKPDDEQQAG
jgi:hypothetical protein